MDSKKKTTIIFLLFIAVMFAINYFNPNMKQGFAPCEEAKFTPYLDHISLTPDPSTADINQYKVDQLPCHPSCCAQQWPAPFDGLTSNEVKDCISNNNKKSGNFVQNSYRCSYGATGCPCMPPTVFGFESSRGFNNGTNKPWIDPSWGINAKIVDNGDDTYTSYEKVDEQKSYYDSGRLINDNSNRVTAYDVKQVNGVSQ